MSRSEEPLTCTVELSTGSFVQLNHAPGHMRRMRQMYHDEVARLADRLAEGTMVEAPNPMCSFERVSGTASGGWCEIWIDVTAIVAVYPIATRPEPPRTQTVLAPMGLVPGEA